MLIEMMDRNSKHHLLDGAKGTLLMPFAIGKQVKQPESIIDTVPASVEAALLSQILAGAEIIQTPTFTQNEITTNGETQDVLFRRNRRAVEIATNVARPHRVRVGVSIGPLGGEMFMGAQALTRERAIAAYKNQMTAALSGEEKPGLFMVETVGSLQSADTALEALRQTNSDMGTRMPMTLTASFNYLPTKGLFKTFHGVTPEQFVAFANTNRSDIIGVGANCGSGYLYADLLTRNFRSANPTMPLLMKLNAGIPNSSGVSEDATPKNAAAYARSVANEGANFIGGCCGTTPDMLRAMKEELA